MSGTMKRWFLAAALVVLVAIDVWGVAQLALALLVDSRKGSATFWGAFGTAVVIKAGLLWLTWRVWVRLGEPGRRFLARSRL
jgi:hypothetical protein